MPVVRARIDVDAEIDISVYCGICGSGVCGDTSVDRNGDSITVTCWRCADRIEEMEDEIKGIKTRYMILNNRSNI